MRRCITRQATIAMVLGVAVSAVAACSSSSSQSSAPVASSSASGSGSGPSQATDTVNSLLTPPTSIGITTRLSAKPPAGKTIVAIQIPSVVESIQATNGIIAAASVLGWHVTVVNQGTGAQDPQNAMQQAINDHPDAITEGGDPEAVIRPQLQEAEAKGIVVIDSDTADPVGRTGNFYALTLGGIAQSQASGVQIADYLATKASKHVLIVDMPIYPGLHAFSQSVVSQLQRVSPQTKTTTISVQLTDLSGGKIPDMVVSQIQRNPDIDWGIFSLGDMATGMHAALVAAGLSGKVSIGGQSAGSSNIAGIKDGQQAVWTAFAPVLNAWRRIDALARIFEGESIAPNNNSLLPTQLLTAQNVNAAPVNSAGYYIGVTDYQAQFEKLWKVAQ